MRKANLAALLSKEFCAPTSATSGLAAYPIEGGVKHTYPERAALLRAKPKKKLTSQVDLLPFGKFDYSPQKDHGCGCNTGRSALLKAQVPSRVRDYVENRVKPLKTSLHGLLKRWGKKWAKDLAKALPKTNKADLSTLIKASTKTLDQILEEIDLNGFSIALMDEISPAMRKAFKDGGLSARKLVGLENDAEAMLRLMDEDALDFAAHRSAELVGKKVVDGKLQDNPNAKWSVNDTTRDGLRKLTSEAIVSGWSAQDLKERILDSFFFSDMRAEMIARTELAFAHVQGNLKGWKDTGVVAGKRWILADTHPFEDVCDENEAEGVVGLEEPFQDGSLGPPAHPNCLCDIVPVLDDEMPGKVAKGEKSGHAFRGNQHTGGIPAGAYLVGQLRDRYQRIASAQPPSDEEQEQLFNSFTYHTVYSKYKGMKAAEIVHALIAHQSSTSYAEKQENKKILDRTFRAFGVELARDTVFYRGFSLPKEIYSKIVAAVDRKKAVVIRQHADRYVPTTTSKKVALKFSDNGLTSHMRVFMEIVAPRGARVLPLHKATGKFSNEKEVMFDRKSIFRVHSVHIDNVKKMTTIRAEFVGSQRHPRGTLKADLSQLLQKADKDDDQQTVQDRAEHFGSDFIIEIEGETVYDSNESEKADLGGLLKKEKE